jgi:hypothetical protein
MQLAEQVLQAHGGAPQWQKTARFSAHVSISGALLPPPEGRPPPGTPHVTIGGYTLATRSQARPTLRELVMEGETTRPFMRIFSSTNLKRYAIYSPARTEFRDMSGRLIEAEDNPMVTMGGRYVGPPLGAHNRILLFGALVWSAIVGPFVLELGGKGEEEPSPQAQSEFRRLRIELPRSLDPVAPVRSLSVDSQGLARRADYELHPFFPGPVVDTLSAYGSFDGIAVPTLRRLQALSADGTVEPTPLVDIEIFDVRFL